MSTPRDLLWPRPEMPHLMRLIGWFALLLGSLYLAMSLWFAESH